MHLIHGGVGFLQQLLQRLLFVLQHIDHRSLLLQASADHIVTVDILAVHKLRELGVEVIVPLQPLDLLKLIALLVAIGLRKQSLVLAPKELGDAGIELSVDILADIEVRHAVLLARADLHLVDDGPEPELYRLRRDAVRAVAQGQVLAEVLEDGVHELLDRLGDDVGLGQLGHFRLHGLHSPLAGLVGKHPLRLGEAGHQRPRPLRLLLRKATHGDEVAKCRQDTGKWIQSLFIPFRRSASRHVFITMGGSGERQRHGETSKEPIQPKAVVL
ncbi:hypothetical protein PGQ11_003977 [Apiospora arundinis]|uniref:Secreted protein n=1 Tax=Apiospora arundinis TaxID=335852 RepID=A0ABR2J6S3_9PEZI